MIRDVGYNSDGASMNANAWLTAKHVDMQCLTSFTMELKQRFLPGMVYPGFLRIQVQTQ
jgi:hypothetical protein